MEPSHTRTPKREHTVQYSCEYPVPLETLWAFFSDPGHLPVVIPGASIDPKNAVMQEGGTLTVYGHAGGRDRRVTVRYDRVTPPYGFTNELIDGPLRSWMHEHRFEAIDAQRSRATDSITYELRWHQRPFADVIERETARLLKRQHELALAAISRST